MLKYKQLFYNSVMPSQESKSFLFYFGQLLVHLQLIQLGKELLATRLRFQTELRTEAESVLSNPASSRSFSIVAHGLSSSHNN